MNILFYESPKDGAGERLQREVEALIPQEEKEIHCSIESLSRRLRQPHNKLGIAVLLTEDLKSLSDLLSIREVLLDLRIILILPDRKEATIAMGHALHPRFLSYADSNFKDVAAVLKKMIGLSDNNNN